jgi:hypothetical protein
MPVNLSVSTNKEAMPSLFQFADRKVPSSRAASAAVDLLFSAPVLASIHACI